MADIEFDPVDSILFDIEQKISVTELDQLCQKLTKDQHDRLLTSLSENYYEGNDKVKDETWDFINELYEKKYGKRKVIGAAARTVELKKVRTSYHMGSLDKIKDDKSLNLWKRSLSRNKSGGFILMDKLDGVSAMYENTDGVTRLIKHGSGDEGTDVSHLIPYLNLPQLSEGEAVRGELILKKDVFRSKYADKKNARSMIAGITNRKTCDELVVRDIDYVVFQRYGNYSQQDQLDWLEEQKFQTVSAFRIEDNMLTAKYLTDVIKTRRSKSLYEMDGIVVADNGIYELVTEGNPDHIIAFKTQGDTETAKVLNVEWNLSQYGVYMPRINITRTTLGGSEINWVTGKNAKFVVDNMIGPGAIVVITKSGDVIPNIISITKQCDTVSLPSEDHKWDDNHTHLVIPSGIESIEVNMKKLVNFFSELNVKYLADKTISKLYAHGLTSIKNYLSLDYKTLVDKKIEGFGELSAQRIISEIANGINNVELATVMSASGVFGFGFGYKRFKSILTAYPDILSFPSQMSEEQIIEKLTNIKGFKTIAIQFAKNLPLFIQFLTDHPQIKLKKEDDDIIIFEGGSLQGVAVVFTKYRNTVLEECVKSEGGEIHDRVTKKTNYVVIKDRDNSKMTTKETTAIKYNIPILTEAEFIGKFNIDIKQ